jgi:predicted DNA-binding transcriptional regulator YafY
VDAQTCELRMTVDDLAWPAMAIGAAGADFEVREPPELVELLRDWSARFARA